ncbi:WLM domain-containing protein [Cordyceps javanica]|uniref:WLM domain-containing protein n=1 Tax=Cordyceps javanica TaxID=43265 RepID=A0A545W6T9_9HYPO|nr:WLM domain-containing protein [Cordyceps javanica]TQW09707.1 WLM domain-containing protein [Cordyceps javanica]
MRRQNALMTDQDQQVRSYVHLAQLPRADDALRMLRRIASAVKPIMRNHRWRVGELAEFYPNEANLLGLNVNRGKQICLRLRYANDKTLFLALDMVIDTMLHELCHNVHGPHNDAFHALWETLRDEHLTLSLSGYSGASFLSQGRRLGGGGDGSGATAVSARERGRNLSRGRGRGSVVTVAAAAAAGRRLGGGGGGAMPPPALLTPEMRRAAAAEAAEQRRRKRALEGCGAGTLDETQIRSMGETASRTGFRTRAEEEQANDAAIARALAEDDDEEQEEEQQQGLQKTRQRVPPPAASSSISSGGRRRPASVSRRAPPAPHGRSLVTVMEQQRQGTRRGGHPEERDTAAGWVCSACTLHNPADYLCCDACRGERSKARVVIDLT